MRTGTRVATQIALAFAGAATAYVVWAVPPEFRGWPLMAGAAAVFAAAIWRFEARRELERVGDFAEAVRFDPGHNRPLDDRGSDSWKRSARALNGLVASLREQADDERVARDRLETVVGALEEAFLVVSDEGRVLFANPQLGRFFAVPDNPEGRTMLEVVRERSILDALRAALEGDPGVGETQLGASGQIQVRYRVSPFSGKTHTGAERHGAVALFHDISELRRAENARSDFLANASHEIKTPLSAVRGYAEILADRVPSDPNADPSIKRAVEAILNNSKRLAALVDDLLELSRIEGGSLEFEARVFDAGEVTRSLLRDFETRARAARVELSQDFETDARVVGDRRAFEQVIGNLVDNALKYTPAGGTVEVRTAPAVGRDRIRIEVRDDGDGIPIRHQGRVFERFYRVDPGRSRSLGGTGLGLAIVKHLVQGMGGEVGLSSELGKGSCFWMELPHRHDASERLGDPA